MSWLNAMVKFKKKKKMKSSHKKKQGNPPQDFTMKNVTTAYSKRDPIFVCFGFKCVS